VVFAHAGAVVVAVDVDLRACEETASQIAAQGGSITPLQADVSDEISVEKTVRCYGSAAENNRHCRKQRWDCYPKTRHRTSSGRLGACRRR
jgi:hypothetical protein